MQSSTIEPLLTLIQNYQSVLFTSDSQKYFSELSNIAKTLDTNLLVAQEEGRNLRIAIVGQMKAGKSSFLNALLFPIDVLPKAATPMTAALTRIGYAEKPYAEIEFYSVNDWDSINQAAEEYHIQYRAIEQQLSQEAPESLPKSLFGNIKKIVPNKPKNIDPAIIQSKISEELRSCRELVDMARQLNLQQYLGTKKRIEATSLVELANELKNYVGSQGKFTAITKMFSIYINDERLHGIEIYDTPGFNDPVISRGQQTRTFLGQCDVVFLLSIGSQFLTVSDLRLLREQLTASGIDSKAVFLVGSQRDLVFRMDRQILTDAKLLAQRYPVEVRPQATISAMMQLLDKKIQQMTETQIKQHLSNPDLDEASKALLTVIQSTEPHLISALTWRIAEDLPNLSSELQEQYDALCFDTSFNFNVEQLEQFSNIIELRKVIEQQKERKQELTQAKVTLLLEGVQQRTQAIQQELLKLVNDKIDLLDNQSIEQLNTQKQIIEKKMKNGRSKLEYTIHEESKAVSHQVRGLSLQLQTERQAFLSISISEDRKIEYEQYEKSGFWAGVARFFGVGGTGTREKVIVTPYAQVQDSIEQIETFGRTAVGQLQRSLNSIIDMPKLRKNIVMAAINLFDTSDPDFDVDFFKLQVSQCLESYEPPKLNLDVSQVVDRIVDKFGIGKVTNSEIQQLKQAHHQAISTLSEHVVQLTKQAEHDLEQYFESMQQILVNKIIGEIQNNLQGLIEHIEQKENTLENLHQFRLKLSSLNITS
ncbi:dynamin family protein [Acinetobacter lwoffii]|uniref:dynamin family protein n=1 Tax=Acinetobacter lwoffii TaxID=28090 RepID=UPI0021CD45BF|nr:dynamin family protein [Acinetobacter lwoffii]MCU4441018.1 dynamin family protein [Acinetobacter lwoffii]